MGGASVSARFFCAVGIAMVVIGMASCAATAAEPSPTPKQSEVHRSCVKAGLMRPHVESHFWLQIYSHQIGPSATVEYRVAPMPADCSAYRRIVSVRVRYRTSLRPWRTIHAGDRCIAQKPGIGTWICLWNKNEGSKYKYGRQLINGESSHAPWGTVQHVESQVRLWVKDRSSKKIIGRRRFRVRTKFCQEPKRSPACAF